MFSVHAIRYETLPAMLCCNDTLMGQNVPQLESEYILLMITLFQRLHNGSAKYLHPPYVSEQFTTDERRTVCNAGFLTESPKSSLFHSRRVRLPLATLALHIFRSVGCRDVRNVAFQHVEIFLEDGTLVQDLNLNLSFSPLAGKNPLTFLTISINPD